MTKKLTQNSLPGFAFLLMIVAGSSAFNKSQAQSADFTMPASAQIGTPVTIVNKSPTAFTAHQWDIDDNGSIDYRTTDATHSFTRLGTNCVRLFSQGSTGRDSIMKCINIVNSTANVNDINTDKMINVYPNPCSGIVNISYNFVASENMEVKIYNATGALVSSVGTINCQSGIESIDLSKEANGLYYVRMIVSGKQITRIISLNN